MRSPRALAAAVARRIFLPIVPGRSKLPFTFLLYRIEGTAEPELLHLDDIVAEAGTAIDIGANLGLYTYALSKRFRRVISFEINEQLTGMISKFNRGNIELIHCGLSSEAGDARFYVPVASGVAMAGWGSLNRDNLPGAEKLIEIDVQLKTLDEFAIDAVDFIKIDVEGHEVQVLKGAGATIERSRPMVLVELKREHVSEIDDWFRQWEYKRCRLEDFSDVQGHRSNHIYVPVERLAKFGIARPAD
jgi:FkbM family methyltransferase